MLPGIQHALKGDPPWARAAAPFRRFRRAASYSDHVSLDDAIAAVMENLSSFGTAGIRAVNDDAVVSALRRSGMGKAEARQLGREAIANLGGYIEPGTRVGGLRPGGPRRRMHEVWWVPEACVPRDQTRPAA